MDCGDQNFTVPKGVTNEKSHIVIMLFGFVIGAALAGSIAYGLSGRTGKLDTSTGDLVGQLADEQSNAGAIAGELERIAGETAAALGELRQLTGRQYTILEAARKRAEYLEDYYRRTSGIIDNNTDSGGDK